MDPILYCDKCFFHFGLLKNSKGLVNSVHAGGPQGICGGQVRAHKPAYAGVFLDEQSKKTLLECLLPIHPNVYAEHITLAFGRHMNETYPIGKKVEFEAIAELHDHLGQCAVVRKDSLVEWLGKEQQPHVTISCGKDVKPMYSNELLKSNVQNMWKIALTLNGTIDYFPRLVL